MITGLITISLVGLAVGIIFSMPIAGPVSILITSQALKGEWKYCYTAAFGSSLIDFVVCFLAVKGFTRLLSVAVNILPYLLLAGATVLLGVGIHIAKTRVDVENLHFRPLGLRRLLKKKEKSGFWTGLLLNASNPTIFFGWLTSSFLVISFVASLGLNVGGLDLLLGSNVGTVRSLAGGHTQKKLVPDIKAPDAGLFKPHKGQAAAQRKRPSAGFQYLFSLCYAFCVALGTVLWYSSFSYFLFRKRTRLRIGIIGNVIRGLGFFLCCLALYFMYQAIRVFLRV